jgi:hypothetical protein
MYMRGGTNQKISMTARKSIEKINLLGWEGEGVGW